MIARPAVSLREAAPADMPALLDLWQQLRDNGPRRVSRMIGANVLEQVERRYEAAMTDPGCRLVVAESGGETVGMALYQLASASGVVDIPAVEMAQVVVGDRYRRRGIGRALVAGAAAYAEELGVEQVVVSVYPQQREANRFYARLGFGPFVVRRVAPVSALRRHLAPGDRRVGALRREVLRVTRRPARRPVAVPSRDDDLG